MKIHDRRRILKNCTATGGEGPYVYGYSFKDNLYVNYLNNVGGDYPHKPTELPKNWEPIRL